MPRFPSTRLSLLAGVQSDDEEQRRRSLDGIARIYTRPLVEHARRRWRRDDEGARELVQGFWARAIDKQYLASFEAAEGRFRVFLRLCLDRYAQNQLRGARRAERLGATVLLADLGGETPSSSLPPDEELERAFEAAWRRSVFELAVQDLRDDYTTRGREASLRAFELYDLAKGERPTYAEIAARLALPVTTVTKQLHAARRDFKAFVVTRVAAITKGDRELEDELSVLFGGA